MRKGKRLRLKITIKDALEPRVVFTHCAGRCNSLSADDMKLAYEANGKLVYEAVGDSFHDIFGGISTYSEVRFIAVDLDLKKVVARNRWDDLTNIDCNDSVSWVDMSEDGKAVDDFSVDWDNETIDYATAESMVATLFLKEIEKRSSEISKKATIEPKAGDFVKYLVGYRSTFRDYLSSNKDLSYAEKKAGLIGLLAGNCPRDDQAFGERYGCVGRVTEEDGRTVVDVDCWQHHFVVIDPVTGEAQKVDPAIVDADIKALLEFCHKNNYHDLDDMLGGTDGN